MDVIVVLVFSAAALIVFACLMARRIYLCEMTLLRREGGPLLRIELRRCVEMHTHADGSGGLSFPEPAETRILTWQFCTLPVWSQSESIGLPASCEGRMGEVRPDEFDQHFRPAFKLASSRSGSARRTHTAVA